MLKQLLGHCKNHNVLPDFQCVYCEHYSTETSPIKLTNDTLVDGKTKDDSNNNSGFISSL